MSINASPDPDYVAAHTGVVIDAIITETPLEDLAASARHQVGTDAMGAVVTFDGVVRNHDGGQQVRRLTYTAHPTAADAIREAAMKIIRKHERARVWVAHRVGPLAIGDVAFVVIARKGVETLEYAEMEKNLLHVLKLSKIYQEGNGSEKETTAD